jgi:hypothetical protein
VKNIKFAFCLLVLALSACAAPAQPIAANTPVAQTIESQASPTIVAPPTTTRAVSPTATQALSPTPDDGSEISSQCLEITNDPQQLSGSGTGLIMLAQDKGSSEIYDKLKSPYLYNLASGEKIEIPGAADFAVSLDNKQMAYVSADNNLVVTDAAGKPINQRPFSDIQIIQWGTNGLFVQGADKQQVFLNPFTGERKSLTANFPNLYQIENGFDSYWYPEVVYDPSITSAIYPAQDLQTNDTYFSLWDVENNKEITTFSHSTKLFIPGWRPEWSIDGSQLVIVIEEMKQGTSIRKLVSIKRDGTMTTLMNMNKSMGTLYYAISPNQEYISFWSPDPESHIQIKNLSLYILNIKTGKAVNYCVISPDITVKPVWSPDSSQLAVELKKDMGSSEVVVVDIHKNIAVKIAENAQPVGWLK